MRLLLLASHLLFAAPLQGQFPNDAFDDPAARVLLDRARAERAHTGSALTSYTALVRSRSAAMLRLPLKDRLLGREESTARVRWSSGGPTVVQLLAGRSQTPDGVFPSDGPGHVFDPTGDRFYFGTSFRLDDVADDFWIAHPLAPDAERHYRFRAGDTLTIRMPDGRVVRAAELRAIPRRESFQFMNASLWIEPETGALVRAVFRPSRNLDILRDSILLDEHAATLLAGMPGLVKPIQADVESIVVEYSLWDFRHWLPRLLRVEGSARVGVFRIAFASETAYRIEAVEDAVPARELSPAEVIAGWGGADHVAQPGRDHARPLVRYLPRDRATLLSAAELPPPVWSDAPEFAAAGEIESLVAELERAFPRRGATTAPALAFQWGLGAMDLIRYNRVEGLSLGARVVAEHPIATASLTARLGTADLHPNGHVAVERTERGRTIALEAYHQLASVDAGRSLELGASLGALLFGRDDGEYFRATGVRVSARPSPQRRGSVRAALFAERHVAAEHGTDWSLPRMFDAGHAFRRGIVADPASLAGAIVVLAPWWGVDPLRPQGGVDLLLEGAGGDFVFGRGRLAARAALPAGDRLRLGLEAAAGTAAGDVPVQYHWFLGGPRTLRGYDGSAAAGTSMVRTRLELVRGTPLRALALFADGGWAGERSGFDAGDALYSAGAGISLLDGMLRFDLTRALRAPTGWRLDLHLDALL
jgi:hypothetical protein